MKFPETKSMEFPGTKSLSLIVDLDKLGKSKAIIAESIKIGEYDLSTNDKGELTLSKDGKVIIDVTSEDVLICGKSFNAINNVLENHYNALRKLIEK